MIVVLARWAILPTWLFFVVIGNSSSVLAWLRRRSPAMLPVHGTLSLEHLKENLVALEIELSEDQFELLR